MQSKTELEPGSVSKCILRHKIGTEPVSLGFQCDKNKHYFMFVFNPKARDQILGLKLKIEVRKVVIGLGGNVLLKKNKLARRHFPLNVCIISFGTGSSVTHIVSKVNFNSK